MYNVKTGCQNTYSQRSNLRKWPIEFHNFLKYIGKEKNINRKQPTEMTRQREQLQQGSQLISPGIENVSYKLSIKRKELHSRSPKFITNKLGPDILSQKGKF
jgi:hypothetical protein